METICGHKNEKKIISSSHDFIKKTSLTNLTRFHNEMSVPIAERRAVDVVHLDFSKVIDSVTLKILRQTVELWADWAG